MHRRLASLIAAGAVGALFVAGPLGASPKGTGHFNKNADPVVFDCEEGRRVTINAPLALWPPNHKYYEGMNVVASDTDGSTTTISLTTTGTHNQYEDDTEFNGSGNTADDIVVDEGPTATDDDESTAGFAYTEANTDGSDSVTTDWKLRAERSGRDQDGRIYTLDGFATFDGADCDFPPVNIVVPHDMRPSNRDAGKPVDDDTLATAASAQALHD